MPLVIGTAGHIDHGKTALVRALTGLDTDRLPEERARGISIDLGFAHFDAPGGLRAGVVDVPGHERFIRNMLAGAHAMDLVLFAVAADDGVMPQTEEHLDILHLLGVRRGIFVVTKTDLADAARVAAVCEEIEILALGTTLEGAPIVPVSAATGAGMDALRTEIARQLARPVPDGGTGRFRLPVDRAFVAHGHGLVVTGTAVGGAVAEGDLVRLLPGGETARVRGLEVHGVAVAQAGRRQRIALNLAGVERARVARGHVVCDPRIDRVTTRADAWIEVRPGARRSIRHHGRVRVHIGTAEVFGKVVLLDRRPRLEPGGSAWGQLVLADPVVAMRGDRFVLRDETARFTLGGGVIVHPFADRHRATPGLEAALETLRGGDDAAAAAAFLRLGPQFAASALEVADALGLLDEAAAAALAACPGMVALPSEREPQAYAPAEKWERFEAAVRERVTAWHADAPLAPGLDVERLRTQLPWDVSPRIFRWALDRLVEAGALVRQQSVVRLPGHRVALGDEGEAMGERLVALLQAGGLTPPDLRQFEAETAAQRAELTKVLGVLEKAGRVVRVAPDLYYAAEAVEEGRRRIAEHCAAHGEITAAAFRDAIGASRKFAIAFLDWCDRTGVTIRVGDARRLRRG